MQNSRELIQQIVNNELCTKCGTCMGVCPTGALVFDDCRIIADHQKCINCGKCYQVCPGKYFPMNEWHLKLFGRHYDSNSLFGFYQSAWTVTAKNTHIYHQAASGGAITQMCSSLLLDRIVDGIVTVKRKETVPYEFVPFIADTEEKILQASQSKYCFIPVNEMIGEIKKTGKKVAFVGLPCQIQGMRKAMENDVALKSQIVILISLFCGFNLEKEATEYMIKKSGISKNDITKLEYRHKQHGQSGFYIEGKNGELFFFNKHSYTFLNLVYSPKRCWKCFDYSGEFADISVGDAWECKEGGSRILVRTEQGAAIWKYMQESDTFEIAQSREETMQQTQKMVTQYKKRYIGIRQKRMISFPEYGIDLPIVKGWQKAKGYLLYITMVFFKTSAGEFIFRLLPFKFLSKISACIKRKETK